MVFLFELVLVKDNIDGSSVSMTRKLREDQFHCNVLIFTIQNLSNTIQGIEGIEGINIFSTTENDYRTQFYGLVVFMVCECETE